MPIIILLIINTVLLAILFMREMARRKETDRVERLVREEMSNNRKESAQGMDAFSKQLLILTQMNEQKLEKVRDVVETRLRMMQEDNSQKLEKMRETVDEKLHSTLEKRLGESFKIVSERLEKVHEGLGEMQNLASGVGDLKKVLTNVKTRGTWGEIQLETQLEQFLTPEQYEKNVATKKGSRDTVEFAIKLPGRNDHVVYIPIDAKYPKEDYDRLLEAQDRGDSAAVEESVKAIENRIKLEAKKIRDKYVDPPHTTDFAIMYLITEGLYAEVLRRPGLSDLLQREFRVMVAGPTTIAAVLNSLQMGFRTLAVERRASEVWQLLGTVRNEFVKFGDILDKTHTRLKQASEEIESAARKSRTIERKLKDVQGLPAPLASAEASGEAGPAGGPLPDQPALAQDRSRDGARESFDDDTILP
ncbi:MAG: recombinase RmuC [Omnitrophica WOR_2 bacterium RIFCSPLOWO2_12_FULL_50_9]|nr:MAG: recombinase RmuC [Omnitrophica WOR_2 bacterium RIFCSPHIGHO2_02_FULL_50_17]OGX42917.1 MAG: recombinase RmuC [Omnitrophica WOR_2 bacterium RIFCSPLOWO2_12_FULL_50_9]